MDSHTRNHTRMHTLNYSQQQSEIWGTQLDLVAFLNQPGTNFCYPYGSYTDSSEYLLARSGFVGATTAGPYGKHYTDNTNMYELKRISIGDGDTLPIFINKLTGP